MNLKASITLTLICLFAKLNADEITIAVAANFTTTMAEIVKQYEANSSHQVKIVSGSSGKFYAQIKNGAPFHGFFSADQTKPLALENANLTVKNSRFSYAIGQLALWTKLSNIIDPKLEVLEKGSFSKIAIANPKLAPYGEAAVEVITNLGLLNETQQKWVRGANIAQTYQYVSSGNAELGFIALSQLMTKSTMTTGSVWLVPSNLHKPIKQDAVILLAGKNSSATADFFQFIRSNKAQSIIKSYGYSIEQNSIKNYSDEKNIP